MALFRQFGETGFISHIKNVRIENSKIHERSGYVRLTITIVLIE